MFTAALRQLPSFKWLSDLIPAYFGDLITPYRPISTFLRSDSLISFIYYSVGTSLAITVPAWLLLYSRKTKHTNKGPIAENYFEAEVNGESSEGLIEGGMEKGDALVKDDALYAEEIQLQETLLASIFISETENDPSSSTQEPISVTDENKPENSAQIFCEICLENKESWEMFTNDKCSHAFCYNCTTSHIITKMEDKVKEVSCPAISCKSKLNSDLCRLIVPEKTLVKWDEFLCMSLIPDSQKLYCPFRDCLAMLVNDSGQVFRKIECLVCKRSFCAECRVPWHSDFTCKEFMKVYGKKGGKDEKIVKLLAKKRKWQKCPKCKMYVEKNEGCVHITCRCTYEFCYRCGKKWSDSHGNCKPKW